MSLQEELIKSATSLYDFCEYPAVRYAILYLLLDISYEDERLVALRDPFLDSDVVRELYETQSANGTWGKLMDKDYSVKAAIPCTFVGIKRCLYLGLTLEDRDLLLLSKEELETYLLGTNTEPLYNKNERAIPWQLASICNMLEAIQCKVSY